jgi:hypothetical protein
MNQRVVSRIPVALFHRIQHEGQLPHPAQQESHCVFGLFIDAEIRNVGDNDAPLRGAPNVNAIRSGAKTRQDPAATQRFYDRDWNFG